MLPFAVAATRGAGQAMMRRRNSVGLLGEFVDPINGELWGAFPQVGAWVLVARSPQCTPCLRVRLRVCVCVCVRHCRLTLAPRRRAPWWASSTRLYVSAGRGARPSDPPSHGGSARSWSCVLSGVRAMLARVGTCVYCRLPAPSCLSHHALKTIRRSPSSNSIVRATAWSTLRHSLTRSAHAFVSSFAFCTATPSPAMRRNSLSL